MKITNKFNVPETLVALASKSTYSKGKADYSVTEIISPPQIQRLRNKHYHEMESDVSEMLWSLMGTALHWVAEQGQADNHLTEERLYAEVDGVVLSGAIDLQERTADGIIITDYKFTGAWSLRNDKPEWIAQQNIYAWLVHEAKGEFVKALRICALVRDWSKRDSETKADYPPAPIQIVEIPLWDLKDTEKYIRERIELHRMAKVADDWGDPLPPCSSEERWLRGESWAVKRDGRKTAIRVLDNEEEAKQLAEKEKGYVEYRPGEPIRCSNNYCGVATWCKQYRQENAGGDEGSGLCAEAGKE